MARPRSARRKSEDQQALFITLGAAAAFAAVIGVMMMTNQAPTGADGCIAGREIPAAHSVVLVDQTDAFNEAQLDYMRVVILGEYDRLRPGEKFSVLSLTADPTSVRTQFKRCRLPQGSEVSELIANPREIEKRFESTVGKPLQEFIANLSAAPNAKASPILEVAAAAMDAGDFAPGGPRRRLVIISDMAQASAELTHYEGAAAQGAGFALAPETAQAYQRDMRGVDVRIHYVRRPSLKRMQTLAHQCFWKRHFESYGAKVEIGWGLALLDQGAAGPANAVWEQVFPPSEEDLAARAAGQPMDPCIAATPAAATP